MKGLESLSLTNRNVIDISLPLGPRTPAYPEDTVYRRRSASSMDAGDPYNLSTIAMSAHSGTHVDAPLHFLSRGASVDRLDPSRWISDAIVLDTGEADMIEARHVEGVALKKGLSVLFRTRNAEILASGRITEDYCALTLEAARVLADAEINIAGIDYLSIERPANGRYPVHELLLGANVLIAENLNLAGVQPGRYTLVMAPLLLEDADGAPARAFLLP